MRTWRVCREPFADLSGEGARIYGGRWNNPGNAMVYTAENPALAVLEVRVHLDLPPDLLPEDFVLLEIELGEVSVEAVIDIPDDPATFGTEWLRAGRSVVLQVPSFLVPQSTNLLIHPAQAGAAGVSIVGKRPFAFDQRLWLP